METVKVDIQKLQLLNDRIAQTIEALNQVRMSVHGIQHTQVPFGYNPYATQAFAPSFAPVPYAAAPYATPYATPYGAQLSPFGGISHTPVAPWQTTPWQPGVSHTPVTPWQTTPWQTGISHTEATPWQQTPWQTTPWQPRMQQTFPFVQYLQPTTIS